MPDFEYLFRNAVVNGAIENTFCKHYTSEAINGFKPPMNSFDDFHGKMKINSFSRLSSLSEDRLSSPRSVLTLNEFLYRNKQTIFSEADANGIDGRVLAAIIVCEFREQLKYHSIDSGQLLRPSKHLGLDWKSQSIQGSVQISPFGRRIEEVACIRADASSIIPLVAESIKTCVNTYFFYTKGFYFGRNPGLVAWFYKQGATKTKRRAILVDWIARLNTKDMQRVILRKEKELEAVEARIDTQFLARWVKDNVGKFEQFKTDVVPPPPYLMDLKAKSLLLRFGVI